MAPNVTHILESSIRISFSEIKKKEQKYVTYTDDTIIN